MKPITTAEELRAALNKLNLNRDQFAEELGKAGIKVTPQAVWKWIKGKTCGVPGYVGFFLLNRYDIGKESITIKK